MNWPTRRDFIKRTVAASGLLGFTTGCQRLQVVEQNDLSREAIDRLRVKLKGRLILPADPSYEVARRVFYWNAGTERRPRVIVQCAHEEDALRAVEFARRHELEVSASAGGHSHLGWGCSNGVVIDLSGMKRIEIDPLRRTARAEGGVLSGEMACKEFAAEPFTDGETLFIHSTMNSQDHGYLGKTEVDKGLPRPEMTSRSPQAFLSRSVETAKCAF